MAILLARKLRIRSRHRGKKSMASMIIDPLDQYSDEALMQRLFELSAHSDENTDELAAIEAVIHTRLFATYGAAEPGSSPRVRFAD
jgi:hypothetical protein